MCRPPIYRRRTGRFSPGLCPPARSRLSNCGRACTARRRRLASRAAGIFHRKRFAEAQNRHSPSSGLQRAGKLLDNRRFTRSADSKITDADHETSERAFAENSFAIKIEPELHYPVVDERERVKDTS